MIHKNKNLGHGDPKLKTTYMSKQEQNRITLEIPGTDFIFTNSAAKYKWH